MLPTLTLILLALTALPLSRHSHWLVRSADFPRLQLALLGLALLLAQYLLLDWSKAGSWIQLAITAGCVAWHGLWIAPYTRLWPKEVATAQTCPENRKLKVMTANVLGTHRSATRFLELVNQCRPDVLVTLESDSWWQEQLDSLEQDMPHTIKCPLDNLYGMHVYSRLPLEEAEIRFLVEDDVPSMHAALRMPCGVAVRMHFLHPAPPSPTENTESKERDAELVIVARSVGEQEQPTIVTGDLNDVAWSSTTRLFRKLSGLLDPRVGRGMFNTFHANIPFMRWPLDHLFHSEHFTVCSITRLPAFGSDHFALLSQLAYTPMDPRDQNGLSPEAEDEARADAIAAEKHVSARDVPEPGA